MSGDRDLLERATRALREATPPTQDELAAGRARLLAAQRSAVKGSRARTLRWVLPLAAVLLAGTALAATPEALERLARAVTSLLGPDVKLAQKPKRAPAKRAEAPRPTPTPTPAPAPQEPAVVPSAEPPTQALAVGPANENATAPSEPSAHESRRSARRAKREQSVGEPAEVLPEPTTKPVALAIPEPTPEPAADDDLASYRDAHRLHFRARDFAGALRAWDAYLAAYPQGTFAVEARYNRAICLVRLGRSAEAKKALQPFAKGEVAHGYRRDEATKLLEALE